MAESPYRDMPKEELAEVIGRTGSSGTTGPQLLATLQARCVSDLEAALKSLETSQNRNAAASEILARRVFWLNLVLTFATLVLAIVGVLTFLRLSE